MGYNMHDLNNAAKNVQESLERRSQEKGKRLADSMMAGGLWNIVHKLFAVAFFVVLTAFFSMFASWIVQGWLCYLIGIISAIVIISVWWNSHFRREHPFLSIVLMMVFVCVAPVVLGNLLS